MGLWGDIRYISRCSVCGVEGLNREGTVCPNCGGKIYVFLPGSHVPLVSILLMLTAVVGYVLWITIFLRQMIEGRINFVPGNVIAMVDFLFAMVALLTVTAAAYYTVQSVRGSLPKTILSGMLGAFSAILPGAFAYYHGEGPIYVELALVGMSIAIIAIILALMYRKEFYV